MARTGFQMAPSRKFRTLVTADPFREFFDLQRDINRLFDEAFVKPSQEGTALNAWTPAVDVFENNDAFIIKLDLPEVSREEVKINLDKNTLSISGERRMEFEEKRDGYHRVERVYGPFYR